MLLVYPKTRHECLYHVSHRMRGRTLTVVLTRHACFAKRRTHTCFRVFQLALLRNPSRRHEKMADGLNTKHAMTCGVTYLQLTSCRCQPVERGRHRVGQALTPKFGCWFCISSKLEFAAGVSVK